MSFFKPNTDNIRAKAKKRLEKVAVADVLNWSESAIDAFHYQLDAYRRNPEAVAVEELHNSLSTLQGAVDALETRTTN
jgi:UDP-glucose 6-dehydrogenase